MRRNLTVYFATSLPLLVSAMIYLQQSFFGEDEFGLVLRTTARLALLVYLVIFITRPLRQLWKSQFSHWLLTNRRFLGIAFAAIMTVHLVFLVWLNGPNLVVPGVIAFLFIFLMLITSFDKPARALGPRRWRYLHKTGLYFIGIIFAITEVTRIRETPGDPVHLGLAALMLLALAIRITAYIKKKP